MFKNEVLSLIFFNTVSTSPQFESHCSRKIFSHLAPYKGIKKKQLVFNLYTTSYFFKNKYINYKKTHHQNVFEITKISPSNFSIKLIFLKKLVTSSNSKYVANRKHFSFGSDISTPNFLFS